MKLNPEERQRYFDEFAASIDQGRRLVQGKGQFLGPILMRAEGNNAYLLLLEDRVRIRRKEEKTFLNQGFIGDRDILLSQISSVKLKRATAFSPGNIQFFLFGSDGTKGLDTDQNRNTVSFSRVQQAEFAKIQTMVETKMASTRVAIAKSRPHNISYIEELEKLAVLRDRGIITEEEFAAKKRQILGI